MKKRPLIIAYDVCSNRRRSRLLRRLRQWGLDAQYSLFECRLSRGEAEELFMQLSEMIDQQTDALLFAWLDHRQPCRGLTRCSRIDFQRPVLYAG